MTHTYCTALYPVCVFSTGSGQQPSPLKSRVLMTPQTLTTSQSQTSFSQVCLRLLFAIKLGVFTERNHSLNNHGFKGTVLVSAVGLCLVSPYLQKVSTLSVCRTRALGNKRSHTSCAVSASMAPVADTTPHQRNCTIPYNWLSFT